MTGIEQELAARSWWRRPQVVAIVTLSALLVVALLLLALVYYTPSQARPLSDAKPQSTAPITEGTLSATVALTGTLEAEGSVGIAIPTGGDNAVVTHVFGEIYEGVGYCSPILEVSGRPVFALPGEFPSYRDLNSGDTGRDVRQLQAGLRACGYGLAVDGIAGPGTRNAVVAMYKRAGYTPPTAPAEPAKPLPADDGTQAAQPLATIPPAQPIIPRSDVVFLPAHAIIAGLPSVGAAISADTKITVTTGGQHVKLALPPGKMAVLAEGQTVHMSVGGWKDEAPLPALPTQPDPVDGEGDAAAGGTYSVTIALTSAPPTGTTTIPCEIALGDQTAYDHVVPASAVTYEGSATVIYVVDPKAEDRRKRVPVKVLATGDTAVAIEGPVTNDMQVYTDALGQ